MRLFWLTPAALLAAGCGGVPLPAETDPAKGREVLTTVLDKWKAGGAPADLKPMVVADVDWAAGAKLRGYEIDPADSRVGTDLRLTVKLQLTLPDGKPRDKKVNYAVAIGPATVVVRTE